MAHAPHLASHANVLFARQMCFPVQCARLAAAKPVLPKSATIQLVVPGKCSATAADDLDRVMCCTGAGSL